MRRVALRTDPGSQGELVATCVRVAKTASAHHLGVGGAVLVAWVGDIERICSGHDDAAGGGVAGLVSLALTFAYPAWAGPLLRRLARSAWRTRGW